MTDDKAAADAIDESAGIGTETDLDPVMDRSMTDDEGAATDDEAGADSKPDSEQTDNRTGTD
jgi:hypothetical protein